MPILFTHMSLDLDACASLWAFRRFAHIAQYPAQWVNRFVPAGWNGAKGHKGIKVAFDPRYDIALDIDLEGHGLKGYGDGKSKESAFHLVVEKYCRKEDQKLLEPLVRFVDLQDSTGSAVGFILDRLDKELEEEGMNIPPADRDLLMHFNLTAVLSCLKRGYGFKNDVAIFEAMEFIFEGFYLAQEAQEKSVQEAEKAEWPIQRADIKIAIAPEGSHCNHILMQHGADFVVWSEDLNMGVTRNRTSNKSMDSLKNLVEKEGETEDWFFHADGWTCSHGSSRSPATKKSKITPEVLANALLAHFK